MQNIKSTRRLITGIDNHDFIIVPSLIIQDFPIVKQYIVERNVDSTTIRVGRKKKPISGAGAGLYIYFAEDYGVGEEGGGGRE